MRMRQWRLQNMMNFMPCGMTWSDRVSKYGNNNKKGLKYIMPPVHFYASLFQWTHRGSNRHKYMYKVLRWLLFMSSYVSWIYTSLVGMHVHICLYVHISWNFWCYVTRIIRTYVENVVWVKVKILLAWPRHFIAIHKLQSSSFTSGWAF